MEKEDLVLSIIVHKRIVGVYRLSAPGVDYIGSSLDCDSRWKGHKSALLNSRSPLQKAKPEVRSKISDSMKVVEQTKIKDGKGRYVRNNG